MTIRRIRAINWGTTTVLPPGGLIECFVFMTGGGHPHFGQGVDCVIEDCIVERPSKRSVLTSTLLLITGADDSTGGAAIYHRASAIRNNYLDCEYNDGAYPLRIGIASLERVDKTQPSKRFLLTSNGPHHLNVGDPVHLAQVLVDFSDQNVFNRVYQSIGSELCILHFKVDV